MDWYCHTWSVHGVMQAVKASTALHHDPTGTDPHYSNTRTHCKRAAGIGQKRSLSCPITLRSISVEQLEIDATDHLRRYRSQLHKQKEKKARSSANTKDVYHDGNFVRIKWIDDHSNENDDDNMRNHLYVEVRIEEALSAAVTFCYYNQNSTTKLYNFEFCLARGLRSSYETIFGWIATITDGLLHVSLAPLRFRSDALSQILSLWIIMEFQLLSKITCSKGNETSKPMILTFTTPSSIAAAGLDTISLAVPPQALSNMYNNVCETKPKSDTGASPQLPMVRAIQSFIEDAFAIDISTFPLTKIVTTYATIGADGRFKPTEHESTDPRTLNALRPWVSIAEDAFAIQSPPP
jgi:hypothetical protein